MPYKLRKAPNRELYWVVGDDGKKHSNEPLPKERAEAQMRALYAAMSKEGGTHRTDFLKDNKLEDKSYSLKELSTISSVPIKKLQQVYNRGIGAYKTSPNSVRLKGSYVKGVNAPMKKKLSKEQWAMARVYSFLDGNPKHDNDLRGGAWYDVFTNPISTVRSAFSSKPSPPPPQPPPPNDTKPPRTIFQQVAQQAYMNPPQQNIGGYELFHSTPTIKFYKKDNVILVGIRGTQTQADWTDANARIAMNQLESSQRFQDDLKELRMVQDQYPPNQYIYYGAGHSLGGAMLDGFLQMGLIQSGVSYNPAIQPKNFTNQTIQNERIFAENDPLYNLAKPFLTKTPEVRPAQRDALNTLAKYVPYAGTAYDLLQGHRLNQFEGGVSGANPKFMAQLRKAGLNPSVYLKKAQKAARDAGYGNGAKLLGFATDGVHKLAMPNEDGKLILFGRVGYGDFLIWSHLEASKKAPQGTASKKRNVFQKSHSQIRGNWKNDPFSPNNLALKILW